MEKKALFSKECKFLCEKALCLKNKSFSEAPTHPQTKKIPYLRPCTQYLGLWVADLSVTQIIQEKTADTERGVINGVQASMNMLMETLKFMLVVAIPTFPQFGYLVIASFSFIVIG